MEMKQNDLKDYANVLNSLYDSGCYFMSILYVTLGRAATLDELVEYRNKAIDNSFMEKNCFIKQPAKIAEMITGKKYDVTVANAPIKDGFNIGYWHNDNTGVDHFVVMNQDKVLWDPWLNSKTVREGYLVSYRCFKEI